MSEFKTKEEYEAWKWQHLKEERESRMERPQSSIELAADSMMPYQSRITFQDVMSLLLLGGLATVFVFFFLPLVEKALK